MATIRVALQGADHKWHGTLDAGETLPDYIVWNHSVYKLRSDIEPPRGYSIVYVQVFARWC